MEGMGLEKGVSRQPAQPGRGPGSRGVPLWSQLKASLLAMIRDERMQEHARLPSEHELCERFGVSRTVVREALNQLVIERVIYKIQGKGAFVAGRREEQGFVGTTIGFSSELVDQRRLVTRRVLVQRLAEPGSRARHLLRLHEGERVVEIVRVLSVDGTPRILVHTAIPEAIVPGLEQTPLETRSLYDTLRRQYGIVFARAERWLEAVTPSPDQAALLEVPASTPLLAIESCSYTVENAPAEYYFALHRTDQARLHLVVG
jgi:GntR family transcriptional regulator